MPNDDLDGVGFVRRRNLDGLEAALERTVLLDRLAILGRRGCADALNFAARESRLQDVGRVERTFGRTRADQRVQLVDEDDGVLILHQLFHDGLQALFKLAAILGAGHDQRKVQRQDALVGEERRNFAIGDALRQAFDDGSLAYARLADQHWIVLGAAAENLNHALQLRHRVPPADRAGYPWRPGSGRGRTQPAGETRADALRRSLLLAWCGPVLRGSCESLRPRSCRISAAKHFSSRSRPSSRCSVPMCLCESRSASSAA